jgi:hypothetical protein
MAYGSWNHKPPLREVGGTLPRLGFGKPTASRQAHPGHQVPVPVTDSGIGSRTASGAESGVASGIRSNAKKGAMARVPEPAARSVLAR